MLSKLLKLLIGRDLPPHQRHSATSVEAARAIKGKLSVRQYELLKHFRDTPEGLTDEEGQIKYDIPGNSYRPMRVDLADNGLVSNSLSKRLTRSNRRAFVWKITDLGRSVFEESE